jgi:hypothetical protein
MKLGVSYNVFDGEELLEGSIKSIRSEVDYISVVYQTVSNFGNHCDEGLVPLLNRLKNDGLIDELFEYKPKINKGGHFNEITKRNIGLSISEGFGCTHHMAMDSDEFYTKEQFIYMKNIIEEGSYDSSACQMTTYYKEPIYRLEPKEEYYVSLIYRIKPNSQYVIGHPFPVLVDPTRRMDGGKCKIFTKDEVEMHHMSYVRNNIEKKVRNSSAKINFESWIPEFLEYFNNWSEGDDALMPGKPPGRYKLIKTDNKFDVII